MSGPRQWVNTSTRVCHVSSFCWLSFGRTMNTRWSKLKGGGVSNSKVVLVPNRKQPKSKQKAKEKASFVPSMKGINKEKGFACKLYSNTIPNKDCESKDGKPK
ncbi:hypothetical protein glysoja_022245 [Glycine soja]|nr:hypothetical protein glysoja_022245 [Glycine soja]